MSVNHQQLKCYTSKKSRAIAVVRKT
uniref:Uncharacterized protein n=1 Tax=Anguilla anguilla TaxID=7936 RepID=A0A0E9TED9_ANGAN